MAVPLSLVAPTILPIELSVSYNGTMQNQLKAIHSNMWIPPGTNVQFSVTNLNTINIIVGKNGCGKSSLLKAIENPIPPGNPDSGTTNRNKWDIIEYITPERGGVLLYEANVDQASRGSGDWSSQAKRVNQFAQFKQLSYSNFLALKNAILEEIEKDLEKRSDYDYTFDTITNQINTLLDNIMIRRDASGFKIYRNGTNNEVDSRYISSGESELISLAIECLLFSRRAVQGKENLLLLDEPDVHLHPDLQARLMVFLKELVTQKPFKVIIATHSTAILGEVADSNIASIAFMKSGDINISFEPISEAYKKILPVFGAHPLSNVFNKVPILIVEGADDERIWQTAVRSSEGKIKLYPVPAGSVSKMNTLEVDTKKIIEAVYDEANAYSLRDRDELPEEIDDLLPITRMRLSCRSSENLMLCDDVLSSLDTSWDATKKKMNRWISRNKSHSRYPVMRQFKAEGYKRKKFDLKDLRAILVYLLGSNKPWEVLVGQAIANLHQSPDFAAEPEGSMLAFLGKKAVDNLLPP